MMDALRTGLGFELYLNGPEKGWTSVELRVREDAGRCPNVSFEETMLVIRTTMALKAVAEAHRLIEVKNFGKVVLLP
jgi:hypothetical protein